MKFNFLSPLLLYVPLSFNVQNPTFCSHHACVCFVWISEQTDIISLHTMNQLLCTSERSVYCAVRTQSLNRIPIALSR